MDLIVQRHPEKLNLLEVPERFRRREKPDRLAQLIV